MADVKRQCPVCGSENLEGEAKCSNCGEGLPTSASAVSPPVQASSAPRSRWARMKDAAGEAKDLAVRAAGRVGSTAKSLGTSAATAAGELATRVGGTFQRQPATRMPVVSETVLYKVWLGAAWAARGAPGEADLQQVNEWLNSRPPEIATCLREMHPPNRPLEASVLFGDTRPPEQLEGKILLLRFVRQYFAKSGNVSEARQKFLAELERWTGIEAGQLASIREQLDTELEIEQEPEQLGHGRSLASLLTTTSAYAVAGGAYAFAQTFLFSRYLGGKAVAGWRSFGDVPKPIKVALVTAVAGGTVVASPFLLAALSTTSIVSLLATLGGGAIAVGGYGVAGGVAVLILSCASASTLSALIGSKLIKDPEVEKLLIALRDLHALVEKSKQLSDSQRDRLRQYDEAAKKLIFEKKVLSTDVVLLRGKIEAMGEEIQRIAAESAKKDAELANMRERLEQARVFGERQDTLIIKLLNDHAAVNASFREDTRRELSQISAELRGSFTAIQENFAKQYLRDQAALDAARPRVFSLRPAGRSSWWRDVFGQPWELQVFCEQPGAWHPQESACWTIKQPPEWLPALAPYLRDICSGLRASMPLVGVASVVAGGPIGAAAGLTASAAIAESAKFIANYVTPMQDLADRLHAMATEACETPGLIEASAGCGKQQADALRLFWKLLDEFDGSLQPAGLHKVLTQDGNCIWLCDKHYALR